MRRRLRHLGDAKSWRMGRVMGSRTEVQEDEGGRDVLG